MESKTESVRLTELYSVSSGLSKPREQFGYGHSFLTFKDVFDNYFVPAQLTSLVNSSESERSNCSIRRGDVFLTRTSETIDDLGMSCVALKDYPNATFNGFTKRLRPLSDRVVPEYAAYYFRSRKFREAVTCMSSLSTRASLNNDMIGRLHIDLPPRKQQLAIGSILKSLDDKIELNRQMNVTLEQMARALFKSWFIDFDPVHAKATGKQPAFISKTVAKLFPASFDECILGSSPTTWEVKDWGELICLEYGKGLRGHAENEGSVPVFGTNGQIGWHTEALCNYEGIIVGRKGAYRGIHYSCQPFFVIDTAYFVRPKAELQMRWAYYQMLQMDMEAMDSGSAIPSTTREHFYAHKVMFPPKPIQDAFVSALDGCWQLQEESKAENVRLSQLRDSLLPQLLSGKIRLRQADKLVEEALA